MLSDDAPINFFLLNQQQAETSPVSKVIKVTQEDIRHNRRGKLQKPASPMGLGLGFPSDAVSIFLPARNIAILVI